MGILAAGEIVRELAVRLLLPHDIQNLVPGKAVGEAEKPLILDFLEQSANDVKAANILHVDEVL